MQLKDKVEEEGEQGLPATAVELRAWQQSDPTLEQPVAWLSKDQQNENEFISANRRDSCANTGSQKG